MHNSCYSQPELCSPSFGIMLINSGENFAILVYTYISVNMQGTLLSSTLQSIRIYVLSSSLSFYSCLFCWPKHPVSDRSFLSFPVLYVSAAANGSLGKKRSTLRLVRPAIASGWTKKKFHQHKIQRRRCYSAGHAAWQGISGMCSAKMPQQWALARKLLPKFKTL